VVMTLQWCRMLLEGGHDTCSGGGCYQRVVMTLQWCRMLSVGGHDTAVVQDAISGWFERHGRGNLVAFV